MRALHGLLALDVIGESVSDGSVRTELARVEIGRIVAVWATDTLTAHHIDAISELVRGARRRCGVPILYWAILDANAEMPAPALRSRLQHVTRELLANDVEVLTVVLAGEGLSSSLLRSALRSMVLIGGLRKRVLIVPSIAKAVSANEELGALSTDIVRAMARPERSPLNGPGAW